LKLVSMMSFRCQRKARWLGGRAMTRPRFESPQREADVGRLKQKSMSQGKTSIFPSSGRRQ
jgi:hypothetical protein